MRLCLVDTRKGDEKFIDDIIENTNEFKKKMKQRQKERQAKTPCPCKSLQGVSQRASDQKKYRTGAKYEKKWRNECKIKRVRSGI